MSNRGYLSEKVGECLSAWRLYGVSFAAVTFLTVAVGIWLSVTSPYTLELELDLGSIDKNDRILAEQTIFRWMEEQPIRDENCGTTISGKHDNIIWICVLSARGVDVWFDAFDELLAQIEASGITHQGWRVTDMPAKTHEAPVWAILVVVIVYLVLIRWLTRTIQPRLDLRLAGRALRRKPWLVATPLLLWFVVANAAMLVLTALPWSETALPFTALHDPDEEVLLATMEGALKAMLSPWMIFQAILLAPIFEESLFRGWLYEKTHRVLMPWINALTNAWFFMLLHLAVMVVGMIFGLGINPVQASPILLPVTFSLGLLLFWARLRFGSLTLCILLHAIYNSAMLGTMFYLLVGHAVN